MAIVHERIKALRSQNGLTLATIADRLGVTEATAQRYETGKGIKAIPYEVIEKYANIFNCSPSYLMGWEETNNIEKPAAGLEQFEQDYIITDSEADKFIAELTNAAKHFDQGQKDDLLKYVRYLELTGKGEL